MSFAVSLSEDVARKLAGLHLSGKEQRAILDGFDLLGSDPGRLLKRGGPSSTHAVEYDLVIPDEIDPGRAALYVFGIRISEDEETLIVVDCLRLLGDSIE